MFSTMTTPPSTTMPSAMAMPPRDMRLAVRPAYRMIIKVVNIVSGSVSDTTSALRTLPKNTKSTTTTKMVPSVRARVIVPSASCTSSARS